MFSVTRTASVPPVIPERPRLKRANIYGDELIIPQSSSVLILPILYERRSPRITQSPLFPGVILTELSGYRIKRDNAYGDEPTLPLAANDEYEAAVPVEEAPVATGQSMPDLANASVASSGY
ncbi:hypothetical protein AB6A40_002725 [Gnathostoma spinigerum]|uniref:Uncharacterized protein n=1 Tax=Gnathostoma spinigerum TaxID=75299 RepID=A0ABD6EF28_9BILA